MSITRKYIINISLFINYYVFAQPLCAVQPINADDYIAPLSEEPYSRFHASSCLILGYDQSFQEVLGVGTGNLMETEAGHKYILTAAHVVLNKPKVSVQFDNNQYRVKKILSPLSLKNDSVEQFKKNLQLLDIVMLILYDYPETIAPAHIRNFSKNNTENESECDANPILAAWEYRTQCIKRDPEQLYSAGGFGRSIIGGLAPYSLLLGQNTANKKSLATLKISDWDYHPSPLPCYLSLKSIFTFKDLEKSKSIRPLSNGFSGSALMDSEGYVIGVTTSKARIISNQKMMTFRNCLAGKSDSWWSIPFQMATTVASTLTVATSADYLGIPPYIAMITSSFAPYVTNFMLAHALSYVEDNISIEGDITNFQSVETLKTYIEKAVDNEAIDAETLVVQES